MGLPSSRDDIAKQVRHYVKLFIAPRGAATRMHQDNHHAHAWLSQVRGRKLYVLCAPQDHALVAPTGSGADAGGTTKEARFDPLDATERAERESAGLRVYATVLQPGETIVCPDCWWHYAISLTPTITLMANFWDAKNIEGLRQIIRNSCKPCAPEEPLGSGWHLRVALGSTGCVVLRSEPTNDAPVVAVMRRGESSLFDVKRGDWVHTSKMPGKEGLPGWARWHLSDRRDAWLERIE